MHLLRRVRTRILIVSARLCYTGTADSSFLAKIRGFAVSKKIDAISVLNFSEWHAQLQASRAGVLEVTWIIRGASLPRKTMACRCEKSLLRGGILVTLIFSRKAENNARGVEP